MSKIRSDRRELIFLPDHTCLVPLTQGRFAVIDSHHAAKVGRYNWSLKGKQRTSHTDYARANVSGRQTKLHRYILGVADPAVEIDHINGDGLDCREGNLRICTGSQNKGNLSLNRANTSGYKGVCWDINRRRWISHLKVKGKSRFLGRYATPEEAARAYDRAAQDYFGEFAKLNFPNALQGP